MKGLFTGVGYAMLYSAVGAGVDNYTKLSNKVPALGGTTGWPAIALYAAILTAEGAVVVNLGKKLLGKK